MPFKLSGIVYEGNYVSKKFTVNAVFPFKIHIPTVKTSVD